MPYGKATSRRTEATDTPVPTVITAGGVAIPQLGFGTYKVTEGTADIVRGALEVGYRHIDTAQMYGNEKQVGDGWVSSGIPREELFITSKLDNPNHEPRVARAAFAKTLDDLQTDYVDLFLIHWPLPMYYGGDFGSTWAVLEEFLAEGSARAIGVSNFEPHHLEKLFQTAATKPQVNQIESHPYLQQDELHKFDATHGIVTEAWSPLARGAAAKDALLEKIGRKYGKTASQVALRWGLERGDVLFPKASSRQRQSENLDVFDFELSSTDLELIASLERGEEGRTGKHPDVMDRL